MKKYWGGIFLFFVLTMGVFAPAFSAHAQTASVASAPSAIELGGQDYETAIGSCSWSNWTPCFLSIVDGFVRLTAWFARITAQILDFFISFSISSSSYQNSNNTFVERGWSIIRDIANVAFIFMLLYIAIKHILQAGSSETKKLLKSLIIAALLINFSLFFCKIIIDSGNILARAFYNNIEMVNDDNPDYKDISVGIVKQFEPQKLFSPTFFKQVAAPGRPSDQPNYGWIFVMQMIMMALNIIIGFMFLSTFLLFAARVIGLWLLMIFSPIAFVSLALPNSGEMLGELGWSNWLKQMVSLSFMAPVFLFFLFLLIMFLEVAFTPSTPLASQDTVQALLSVFVPFIAVVLIMRIAKERAKDMAGKVGEMTTKAVGKALGYTLAAAGVAGGAALGLGGMVGRRFVGQSAARELASGVNQDRVRMFNAQANEAAAAGNHAEAAKYRSLASEHADRVNLLERRRSRSYDLRQDKFLKEKVFGSRLGQALVGKEGIAASLGAAVSGGEKLTLKFGKGADTNVKKQEQEQEKKALEMAKLYDTGAREEDSLALIGYTARKGMVAKDELVEHIGGYLEEIQKLEKKGLITQKEAKDRRNLADKWMKRVETATKDEDIQEVVEGLIKRNPDGSPEMKDGKAVRQKDTSTGDESKKFAGAAKRAFADVYEASTAVHGLYGAIDRMTGLLGGQRTRPEPSSVIADKIRKGPKKDLDKSLKDLIEEANKGGDKGGDKKPEPEKPKPKPSPDEDDGA